MRPFLAVVDDKLHPPEAVAVLDIVWQPDRATFVGITVAADGIVGQDDDWSLTAIGALPDDWDLTTIARAKA